MSAQTYTLPPNLHRINQELNHLDNVAGELRAALELADTKATRARYEAYKTEVLAFFSSDERAVDAKKQAAKRAALEPEWKAREAELAVRTLKEKLKQVYDRSDHLRSIGSNIKNELENIGHGYGSGS